MTVKFVIAVNESMMYASDKLIIIVSDDPYIAAIRVWDAFGFSYGIYDCSEFFWGIKLR